MTSKDMASRDESLPTRADPRQGGQFVERMFSGFAHTSDLPSASTRQRSEEPYRPLPQSRPGPGAMYRLQTQTPELRVRLSSPATDVMTDLSRVAAVTVPGAATLDQAHQTMISERVRALFVVDEARAILGLITSSDIQSEKPIQIAQRRGVRHVDVLVREVMTPADLLETLRLQDVLEARVGDIVETLKSSGRQHALVIEPAAGDEPSAGCTVRGMFSVTQIARQLGLPPQIKHDVARTFAEIEAALGA